MGVLLTLDKVSAFMLLRRNLWSAFSGGVVSFVGIAAPAKAEAPLQVVYPPNQHETVAEKIFLIGTAAPNQPVLANGEPIEPRSPAGHFAPSYPLHIGENRFTLTQGDETITLTVTRLPQTPQIPEGAAFLEGSLLPSVDMALQPGERVCLGAIAAADAQVSAELAGRTIILTPQTPVDLPPNSAVLTDQNTPLPANAPILHQGCRVATEPGNLGQPTYNFSLVRHSFDGQTDPGGQDNEPLEMNGLSFRGQDISVIAPGTIEILEPNSFEIAEVITEEGVARTGPSTSYSRITPLPRGTRAAVTGRSGDWLRLDYGGWIRADETQTFSGAAPPRSIIRSVSSRQISGWTEVRFPLQLPVPISIDQTGDALTLTLHNTTPQTDTIYFDADPVVERLDWRPILPDKAEYRFQFRSTQQWGYKVRYEGTTLVLSLRHSPASVALRDATILLDPGHGGPEDLGARGPNGTPEKAVNLTVAKLLRDELESRGATVIMTRETDVDIYPGPRADQIARDEPTLALSIHYNALPDSGDALNTAGVGMFWYHAQAHDLAEFLHDYLVDHLNRPSYGVFWNNLALTRPHVAPSVLLELGFMINPYEFEWITDPASQQELAMVLANAIQQWIAKRR